MLLSSLRSILAGVAAATVLVLVVTLIQPVHSAVAADVPSIPAGAVVPAPPATDLVRRRPYAEHHRADVVQQV